MNTDDTDAGSEPEVRKKVAHGETVGMEVKRNKPRRGGRTSTAKYTKYAKTSVSIVNRQS
jgi:hypothetical protein